jgi:hypothetical protein
MLDLKIAIVKSTIILEYCCMLWRLKSNLEPVSLGALDSCRQAAGDMIRLTKLVISISHDAI